MGREGWLHLGFSLFASRAAADGSMTVGYLVVGDDNIVRWVEGTPFADDDPAPTADGAASS